MSPAIAEIHAGHRDITYLLHVLGHQVGAFQTGRTPDVLLMRDIVARLNEYAADGCDGRERRAIEGIARQETTATPQCVTLTTEHSEIRNLGERVLTVIDDIAQGLLLPRSALTDPCRRFIRMFRGHLHRERGYLKRHGAALSRPAALPDDMNPADQGLAGRLGGLRERISRARRNAHLVGRGQRVCRACDIGAG